MSVEKFYKEWILGRPNLPYQFFDSKPEIMAFAEAYNKHKYDNLIKVLKKIDSYGLDEMYPGFNEDTGIKDVIQNK